VKIKNACLRRREKPRVRDKKPGADAEFLIEGNGENKKGVREFLTTDRHG
jgi:hypothetical protein